MKEKINTVIKLVIPKLQILDTKIATLIPNPKTKKILYIVIGSLFGFMFLIIILGLLFSPLKSNRQEQNITLNKTKILIGSPAPKVDLSENQKEILKLETTIKDLRFPESILNLPNLETGLKI